MPLTVNAQMNTCVYHENACLRAKRSLGLNAIELSIIHYNISGCEADPGNGEISILNKARPRYVSYVLACQPGV